MPYMNVLYESCLGRIFLLIVRFRVLGVPELLGVFGPGRVTSLVLLAN